MRRSARHPWGLVLAGALAVGACSSDADDSSSTGSPATTPTSAVATPATTTTFRPLPTVAEDDDADGIGPPRPEEFGPADMPTACLLVTAEEIAGATGATPATGEEIEYRGATTCWFRDEAGEKLVGIGIVAADARPAPADVYTELSGIPDAAPVEGVGDSAVWSDDTLATKVRDELLTVRIEPLAGVPDDQLQSASEALARIALGRYPPGD